MLLLVVSLFGCFSSETVEPEDLGSILGDLVVDFEQMSAYDDSNEVSLSEIVDCRDPNRIWIQINQVGEEEPIRILVTDAWIFSTRDMSKTANPYDTDTLEGLTFLLRDYTELIDLDDFLPSSLIETMVPLSNLMMEKSMGITHLTGLVENEEPLEEGFEKRVTLDWSNQTIRSFQCTIREIEDTGMPRQTLLNQQYNFYVEYDWIIESGFPDLQDFVETQ
jgi:hypothetical protein